ncbi:MAG: DNA primase large subunit PriL [Archaeoglobaceae archaeon]|nr:DNA primase large subunit PriL [Archaeoglobaceae archaeon]MCX8152206.1 DNA primase large subunit PriL [Archaeoglobaceae archaeon]MDW8013992.1 DNA primase large subunit PriL [Archaeoglobaceae archaeon]
MIPLFPIISRYPFLKVAAKVFENLKVEDEILKFPEVLEEAKKIVELSLEGKKFERKYLKVDIICSSCDEKCVKCRSLGNFENCNFCCNCFKNCKKKLPEEEWKFEAKRSVLRYVVTRSLASQLEERERMRFAVVEASYYADLLKSESDAVVKLLASDFGLKLRSWNTHVVSYVRASSRIKSPEWRLINRKISLGYVRTDRREVERIIVEILRSKLMEKTPTLFELKIKKKRKLKEFEVEHGNVEAKFFPPCMKEILIQLKNGLNVSHSARFAIASFLLNIGMKVEEVVEIFRTTPDFNEEKTRYQVEHIAGQKGRGVEYVSPSCDTMKTYQLCISNCKVNHPINYYRKVKKSRKEKSEHV